VLEKDEKRQKQMLQQLVDMVSNGSNRVEKKVLDLPERLSSDRKLNVPTWMESEFDLSIGRLWKE